MQERLRQQAPQEELPPSVRRRVPLQWLERLLVPEMRQGPVRRQGPGLQQSQPLLQALWLPAVRRRAPQEQLRLSVRRRVPPQWRVRLLVLEMREAPVRKQGLRLQQSHPLLQAPWLPAVRRRAPQE
jgi:hypothetical protein